MDSISQDVVSKSEISMRSLIDLKTKMQNDANQMADKSDEMSDQLSKFESNISIL